MATISKKYLPRTADQFGGVPFGNRIALEYNLTTTSAGAVVDSDSTSAAASGDVVRIGIFPAGTRLIGSLAIVSDAFTASVTAKIGFAYVDGVDDSSVPQDDDYFYAAVALNTAGRYVATNTGVRPVTLPKDAYVIVTIGGANNASVGICDLVVDAVVAGV